MPTFRDFVLTTAEAVRLYGCCLTFFEPITITKEMIGNSDQLINLFYAITKRSSKRATKVPSKEDVQTGLASAKEYVSAMLWKDPLFTQRSICLLSYYPYFQQFKKYLTELYRLSCSGAILPIEVALIKIFALTSIEPLEQPFRNSSASNRICICQAFN